MRINLIENIGAGHNGTLEVRDGLTIADFFKSRCGEQNPASFSIRVNNERARSDYTLQVNDSVTLSPIKLEGGK